MDVIDLTVEEDQCSFEYTERDKIGSAPTGWLSSDQLDKEGNGYISVTGEMKKEIGFKKKEMKWISSLPMGLAITKQNKPTFSKEDCIVNSSLISKEELKYLKEKGLTIREYLFSVYDIILFPVFLPNHWSLFVWYIGSGSGLWHYDTLKTVEGEDLNFSGALEILNFLKWGGLLEEQDYRIHIPTWIPTQLGSWECGHYLLITVVNICICYMKTKNSATPPIDSRCSVDSYNTCSIIKLWGLLEDDPI